MRGFGRGLAFGAVLAVSAVVGTSVGWSSHTVGEWSHPEPAYRPARARLVEAPELLTGRLRSREAGEPGLCGYPASRWYRLRVDRSRPVTFERDPRSPHVAFSVYDGRSADRLFEVFRSCPTEHLVPLPLMSTSPQPPSPVQPPDTVDLAAGRTYLLQVVGFHGRFRLAIL